MKTQRRFPFGQPLTLVEQRDRAAKRVFVLGVYASAVHARWIGPDGSQLVRALAVASEPYIFWRGDGASEIIERIDIPDRAGKLVPADPQLNGPSGVALDELILKPLGYRRDDAWLCDLVPYSCVNPSQQLAIDRAYRPLVEKLKLPIPSIPQVPKILADQERVSAIAAELCESKADTLVLLGDQPIKWFLRSFDRRWRTLSDAGRGASSYGQRHHFKIAGRELDVIPLAHPRQIAKLGHSSDAWCQLHQGWVASRAK